MPEQPTNEIRIRPELSMCYPQDPPRDSMSKLWRDTLQSKSTRAIIQTEGFFRIFMIPARKADSMCELL